MSAPLFKTAERECSRRRTTHEQDQPLERSVALS